MDANLRNNGVSQVIEIEDDVIDLDGAEKTPEDALFEWDAKTRKKLSKFALAENENTLWDLMKDYLQNLQEKARIYEDNETLKNIMYRHISCLYSYYVELQCCNTPDNYLNNMEDILTLYCNSELEVIRPLKKKDFGKQIYRKKIVSVSRRIIRLLTVHLLGRHDHILHVLIKINTSNLTESCSEVLTVLYSHFLTKVPVLNLSDESFCRYYIVFQKWKEIRKKEEWEGMDKIMYKMLKRTPESVKNNETLRQILMPSCNSTVDIVINLFRTLRDISNSYFKHIATNKKTIELDDFDFNIDLGEDQPTIPIDDENEEEVCFMKAYNEVERSMSNLSTNSNSCADFVRQCKQEFVDDDDVQFVGITMLTKQPSFDIVIDDGDSMFSEKHDIEEASTSAQFSPSSEVVEVTPNHITSVDTEAPPAEPPPEQISTNEELTENTVLIPESPPTVVPPTPTVVEIPDETTREEEEVAEDPVNPETIESPSSSEENCNLLTTICVGSPRTVVENPDPCQPTPEPSTSAICSIKEVLSVSDVTTAQQQPEVSLTTSSENISVDTRTKKMKSVEVQADNNIYNDYGLTTPPFDTNSSDEQSRPVEPRLYTDIAQNRKKNLTPEDDKRETRSVETQVEPLKNCPYNDYGLTPPNESHSDDQGIRVQDTYLYTNIVQKDDNNPESEGRDLDDEEFDPEYNEIRINPDLQVPHKIDTGQILNTAPNIETFNGNTVLKPLVTSIRTNGQSPQKIMFTSSQKIKTIPLDDFSRFENAHNNVFDDIMAGPVSKPVHTKNSHLLSPQDKVHIFGNQDSNSRSNSPNDMTSPAYEDIDDFRNYYSSSLNGHVPPPNDTKVPPGILKKSNSTKRKNYRIMFHESTCDNYEERKARSDGVLVLKRVRRDRKLNMEARVVVERLSFIENKMKKVLNNPPTLRVDYDKTTTHINEKDVVRCISPPRFSWIVNIAPNRTNTGKVKSLIEKFSNLNCQEKTLNLTIPQPPPPPPVDPETEFSNSPPLPDTNEVIKHCLQQETEEPTEENVKKNSSLLCDNSNFYNANLIKSDSSHVDDSLLKLPTAVPESYDFEKNLKNEVFSKIDWQDDSDGETRLPLKKRKLPVKSDEKPEEISYPATPMISIAEVEALHSGKLQANSTRPFKTPAERKEMPPLPVFYNVTESADPSPIITDQFNINNHTYNNPTINYHMNNVPVPFINIPCGSYYSLPPILVPFNNVTTFEQNKVNTQQQETFVKKENRRQTRRRRH